MLELTLGGKKPITLPNGDTRSVIADGDTVTLRGCSEHAAVGRIDLVNAKARCGLRWPASSHR